MTTLLLFQVLQDSLVDVVHVIQNNQDEVLKEGAKWFNKISSKFLIRLVIDIVSLIVLIRGIYYSRYQNKAFFLPFAVFNLVIFLITFLLNKVDLSLGAAFGLFAVFGIMRYRSEDISIKNLTYLFVVIAIGLLSAIAKGSWEEIMFYNFLIIAVVFLLESKTLVKSENSKLIYYDNIELLKPENRLKLIEDLQTRTGYKINKIDIERIDFLRDSAVLRVYYED